jgi:hypothetical protein
LGAAARLSKAYYHAETFEQHSDICREGYSDGRDAVTTLSFLGLLVSGIEIFDLPSAILYFGASGKRHLTTRATISTHHSFLEFGRFKDAE